MDEIPEIPDMPEMQGFIPLVIEHKREMPQWEYEKIPSGSSVDILNEWGIDGWQVAAYLSNTLQLLLIREILPPPPEEDESKSEPDEKPKRKTITEHVNEFVRNRRPEGDARNT